MKTLFALSIALLFIVTPVYAAPLSDATGLVNRLNVQTSGYTFEVKTTSNFDISDFEFNKDAKKLTLYISSGLENNLGEVILPQNLLGGNLTFYLNGEVYVPDVRINEKISFITLNFTGAGDNILDIIGTDYLSGLSAIPEPDLFSPPITPASSTDLDDDTTTTLIMAFIATGGIMCVMIYRIKTKK